MHCSWRINDTVALKKCYFRWGFCFFIDEVREMEFIKLVANSNCQGSSPVRGVEGFLKIWSIKSHQKFS